MAKRVVHEKEVIVEYIFRAAHGSIHRYPWTSVGLRRERGYCQVRHRGEFVQQMRLTRRGQRAKLRGLWGSDPGMAKAIKKGTLVVRALTGAESERG